MKPSNIAEELLLETSVAEMAVPAHIMWLASKSVVTSGHVLRQDIVQALNRATMVPFTHLKDNPVATMRVAKRVDADALSILNEASPNDALHAFYTACMFVLVLVEENFLADKESMAVLVALSCINDLKEHGGVEGFSFKERILNIDAKRLLDIARKRGLYQHHLAPDVPLRAATKT